MITGIWLILSIWPTQARQYSYPVTPTQEVETLQFAQSSACTRKYNQIQSELERYNNKCSGTMTDSEYQSCKKWYKRIKTKIAKYNKDCWFRNAFGVTNIANLA